MRKLPLPLVLCLLALSALVWASSQALAGASHFDDVFKGDNKISDELPKCPGDFALTYSPAAPGEPPTYRCINRDGLPDCDNPPTPQRVLTSTDGLTFICTDAPAIPACPAGQFLSGTGNTFTCQPIGLPACAATHFLTANGSAISCKSIAETVGDCPDGPPQQFLNSDGINFFCSVPYVPPPAPFCGDNMCNNSEICSTCSVDCGACPPPSGGGGGGGPCPGAPFCGACNSNGSCESGETCLGCNVDCGTCPPSFPVPPWTPPPWTPPPLSPCDAACGCTSACGATYCGGGCGFRFAFGCIPC